MPAGTLDALWLKAAQVLRWRLRGLLYVLPARGAVPAPAGPFEGYRIGYLFAGSERNIVTWVQKGLVDVGAISDIDWDNPQLVPPAFRPDLEVIATTPDYPRALEMVRGDLDARIRERLRTLLLEAASDPEAGIALAQYFHSTGFVPVDAQSAQGLRELQRGVLRVKDQVE